MSSSGPAINLSAMMAPFEAIGLPQADLDRFPGNAALGAFKPDFQTADKWPTSVLAGK